MDRKQKLHIIGENILDYVNRQDIDTLSDTELDEIIEELESYGKLGIDFDHEALKIAEKYGIIEYTLKSGIMTYIEKLPTEGTYLHKLDLRTMNWTVDKIPQGRVQ
jgi:hypothetical protein